MSAVPSFPSPERCHVSIVIKAFNEEKNICAAIESSLAAVAEVGGEVILADSNSTDRTVELASRYPIRIVQLVHANERCCGIGPQLGYQHSRGDYVYILDGDMQMVRGFLPQALIFLAQHPEAAGVGGRLVELNEESLEYRERAARNSVHLSPGEVDRLDGGGLYRRRAIEEAGYLSDRNLHAYEEFDLAVRLRALGWKLWRIPARRGDALWPRRTAVPLADAPLACPLRLCLRRTDSRRSRPAQPAPRAEGVRELRIYAGVLVWWAVLADVPFWPVSLIARLAIFPALAARPWC